LIKLIQLIDINLKKSLEIKIAAGQDKKCHFFNSFF